MLPFKKNIGNDWIKSFDDNGYSTGTLKEFKAHLFSKRVDPHSIKIDLPKEKLNGSTHSFDTHHGYSKFEILKKIADGSIEEHPSMGGRYHSWIQIVIAKCVVEGFGDNEILKLIQDVHKDTIGSEYIFPFTYQKWIAYTRKEDRFNKPNPGDTNKLEEGKGLLDHFQDEENEKEQQNFFEDTIYMKYEDRWYSKKTGKEYKNASMPSITGDLLDTFKGSKKHNSV